jgi:hypothetical protein
MVPQRISICEFVVQQFSSKVSRIFEIFFLLFFSWVLSLRKVNKDQSKQDLSISGKSHHTPTIFWGVAIRVRPCVRQQLFQMERKPKRDAQSYEHPMSREGKVIYKYLVSWTRTTGFRCDLEIHFWNYLQIFVEPPLGGELLRRIAVCSS